jgi:hypothetical protein
MSCRWSQTVHSTSPSHSQTPFHPPGLLETPSCHAGEVKQYILHPFILTDAFSSTWPFGDSIMSCRWGQTVQSPSHSLSQTPFHPPRPLETPSCHAGGVKQYNLHPIHSHRRLLIHLAFRRLLHVMQVGSNSTISIPFTLTDAFSSTWPFGDSIMSCKWGQTVQSPSHSLSQTPFHPPGL